MPAVCRAKTTFQGRAVSFVATGIGAGALSFSVVAAISPNRFAAGWGDCAGHTADVVLRNGLPAMGRHATLAPAPRVTHHARRVADSRHGK